MSQQYLWGDEETKLFEVIDKTQDLNVLQPLLANLRQPNAFHFWNDVRISSLQIASIAKVYVMQRIFESFEDNAANE